jgi:hypothetical protein
LRNGVTLHFLDRNPAPSDDFGAWLGAPHSPGARPTQAAFTAAQEDLREMAVNTGGIFVHETDPYAGLRQVMDPAHGKYRLGYYLDDSVSSKRSMKVQITSTRKRVRIRHGRSYPAPMTAPVSTNGTLSFGVPVSLDDDGREGQFLPFTILVEPRDLGYELSGTRASVDFTLHVQVVSVDGSVLADSFHLVNHSYPRDLWEASQVEPVEMRGWTELPPGNYRLTAYLRNMATGDGLELAADCRVPSSTGDREATR